MVSIKICQIFLNGTELTNQQQCLQANSATDLQNKLHQLINRFVPNLNRMELFYQDVPVTDQLMRQKMSDNDNSGFKCVLENKSNSSFSVFLIPNHGSHGIIKEYL